MTTVVKIITLVSIALISLVGCSNGDSLQRYLVDKQNDDNFVKVDLASSLLDTKNNDFSQEQKEILSRIRKVNIVAYPINNGTIAEYQAEKTKLNGILMNSNYKELVRQKSDNMNITLKYIGDEEAIDEVIVFASDDEKGFAVFRLLGDDMRAGDMMKLSSAIQQGNLDLTSINSIGDMFKM